MDYEYKIRTLSEDLFKELELSIFGSKIMDFQNSMKKIVEDEKQISENEGEQNGRDRNDDCNCGCDKCEDCEYK
jgi:hypothetical protein